MKGIELSTLLSAFALPGDIGGASFAAETPLAEPIANVEFIFMLCGLV